MRKVLCGLWLCALLLTSCGIYTPPSPLPIQSVTPVASLPTLPERETKTLRTYTEALNYAQDLKTTIEELGGQIDIAANDGMFDCRQYFDLYQQGGALPVLTPADKDDELLVWAADEYNTAVSNILEAGGDTYRHCQASLLGEATHSEIAPLAWGNARLGVTEAVDRLHALIVRMQDELPDDTTYIGTGGQVLKATREAIDLMGDIGYELDKRLVICPTFIEKYEQVEALPEFDVTNTDPIVKEAYEDYRWAVSEVVRTSRDQYLDCKDLMTTGLEQRSIPWLTWSVSRKGLDDAVTTLHKVETRLGEYAR